MSGMVAFEPSSLQQLSNNLDALAQNLEGNLSKIVSLVAAASGHVNGSGNISTWTEKARADANDMSSRAREAWELVRQGKAYRPPNFSPVFSPGMVDIDWAATSGSGRQGQQDAKDLNLGRNATRDQLAAAARSAANHKNDKVYLNEFWSNADPRIVQQLARILHDQDMKNGGNPDQPLSRSSKKVLADLAIGVAAATKMDAIPGGKKELLEKALEDPQNHDMWSSAMLFKYGPKGDQYDASFLKEMGAKALDWRRTYGQMPSPVSDGYKAPDGAWYTSLGITGPWLSMSGISHNEQTIRPGTQTVYDWDRLAKVVADNDPAAAILGKVGDSPAASRALLQDRRYAKEIVNPNWTVPKFSGDDKGIDISNAPGRVVVSATADRARFPKETANAALNVFLEVAALRQGFPDKIGKVKGNLSLKGELPSDLTRALAVMGRSYIPDLLPSADGNLGSTVPDGSGNKVSVGSTDLKTYLSILAKDPTALGIFRGGIDSAITQSVREKLIHGMGVPDNPRYLGELSGLAALAAVNEKYGKAEAADMAAARNAKALSNFVGVATGVPLPEVQGSKAIAVSWLKFLAGQGSGKADSIFDGGNVAEAGYASEKKYEQVMAEAKLPVAQGIYDAWRQGHLSLPAKNNIPRELMQGDHLVLKDDAAVSRFESWFASLPEGVTKPYASFKEGFGSSTADHKDEWEK